MLEPSHERDGSDRPSRPEGGHEPVAVVVPAPGIQGPEGDLEIAPSVAVGRRIRALRRARGVTLAELARRIGTQHQNVLRLEGGAHEPLLGTLVKVARALGVRVADLVNDVDAPASA